MTADQVSVIVVPLYVVVGAPEIGFVYMYTAESVVTALDIPLYIAYVWNW